MRLIIAQHSGFCFGVKRALEIAKKTVAGGQPVYIKGDLVHNEEVCRNLEKSGIKNISSLDLVPAGSTLIIKAHGETLAMHKAAAKMSLNIIDATCPMVQEIHKKAKDLYHKGYQVVIIGDASHEETIGILGHVPAGVVVETLNNISDAKSKLSKKIGVVVQSTQNIGHVCAILTKLAEVCEEMLFCNTICHPTRLRQKEIADLSRRCQAVLIVGSRRSANTKRLYEVAKKLNKNVFWSASERTIKRARFNRFKSLGIIGGASTPQETLEAIYSKLSSRRA